MSASSSSSHQTPLAQSPVPLIPEAEDTCAFLNTDTLVFDHFGPRVVTLGTSPQVPRSMITLQKRLADIKEATAGRKKAAREALNRSVDVPPLRSLANTRTPHARRRARQSEATQLFNLSPPESATYSHFVQLLRSFSPESAHDLLRQVQKDAELA